MKRIFRTDSFALLVAAAFMVGPPLAGSTTPLSHGNATAESQAKKPKGKAITIDAKAKKREEILKWLKVYLRDAGEEFDSYDPQEKTLWTKLDNIKIGRYLDSLKSFKYSIGWTIRDLGPGSSITVPLITFNEGKWAAIKNDQKEFGSEIVFSIIGASRKLFENEEDLKLLVSKRIENRTNYYKNEWINSPDQIGKRFLAALRDLVDLECSGPAEKSPYE